MTLLTDKDLKKGQRLLQLRLQLGLTQTEFGEKLTRNGKVVSQNYLSAIEQGRKKLGDDVQSRIEARFNVRRQWLDEGVGAMFTDESNEPTTEQQLRIKAAIGSMTLPPIKTTRQSGNLTWVAVRERGAFLRSPIGSGTMRRTPFPLLNEDAWAFEVAESSMAPLFPHGAWLICSLLPSYQDMVTGMSYVIQLADQLLFAEYNGMAEGVYRFRFVNSLELLEVAASQFVCVFHVELKLTKP
ncbi:helix-turn-helix domain-containing protein [Spirosoma fluviale]|uniref:Transcriptional regulator, contains XRE-family HTH domain n=1 Tax=Spirosoma fluviale TaxID=1597977 RepID=A0A286FD06_9BACT|nr:helix-turn-helix transcriptional regulator [Spirosoma fluviale]SOD81115.1 Transcriptional regulator, contains XRE-family HTH domain [Spirosoma fluviale]